jgi:phage terminase large subunit-like protein
MEDEMTTWDPEKSNNSPNRLDAVVWLVTELGLNGPAEVEIDSF